MEVVPNAIFRAFGAAFFRVLKQKMNTSDICTGFPKKKHRKKTSIHHCDEARSFLFIVVQKRSNDKRIYLFCDNLFLRWYSFSLPFYFRTCSLNSKWCLSSKLCQKSLTSQAVFVIWNTAVYFLCTSKSGISHISIWWWCRKNLTNQFRRWSIKTFNYITLFQKNQLLYKKFLWCRISFRSSALFYLEEKQCQNTN